MAGAVFKSSDLLADLERIVKLHTLHYQEDFELDKKLLTELCASATPEDHHVIWMSRVSGTHCLREREIFLTDSYENHVWHVKLWEIAEKLGCADATLSRKLRKELSETEKKQIIEIIACIALENQGVE